MPLADLMKKGFLTSATATPATFATHGGNNRRTVATVATVAVANSSKFRFPMPSVATVAGVAVAKPQNLKSANLLQSLAQFEFDLMQDDIDAGYPVEELNRVNNMAWEFMQVDRMTFDKAIKLAAEIVVHGQVEACEAAYEDVQALWRKVTYA